MHGRALEAEAHEALLGGVKDTLDLLVTTLGARQVRLVVTVVETDIVNQLKRANVHSHIMRMIIRSQRTSRNLLRCGKFAANAKFPQGEFCQMLTAAERRHAMARQLLLFAMSGRFRS
jgi:hypothetical protein